MVGTINYKKPGQIRQSARITVHENYKPQQSHQNDVALIKVRKRITNFKISLLKIFAYTI